MNSSIPSLALVVEDDQFQREILTDLLKTENMDVIQCESAEAAELVIAKVGAELKLLVTDVRLAGHGNGIELAEFAQQQKEAEQQRRAKQTEKDTAKKEKKNVSANISILSTLR